ncbi:MAG: hypothetical protein GYB68_10465, partial [Chloroflexi bacterium]|nr:hypothetical protein [Chloroflexota bacterium]
MTEPPLSESAAILTIQAASPGGVPALVDLTYRLFSEWGYAPVVYRADFAEGKPTLLQRLALTLRRWRAQPIEERGLNTMIVPAPPLPLWAFYAVPQFLGGPLLGQHDQLMVISGSAHVALPAALRGIPYTLWVATLYQDELRAKADQEDGWAKGVLNSPTWPLLLAQERLALRRAGRILALSPHTAERIQTLLPEAADRIETVLYP